MIFSDQWKLSQIGYIYAKGTEPPDEASTVQELLDLFAELEKVWNQPDEQEFFQDSEK